MTTPETTRIDEVEYVRADSVAPTVKIDGDWVMVRSRDAGVFAGQLSDRDDSTVYLNNARRIWYWDGAATLSELAIEGTSEPENCKFPTAVPEITVLGVCEIIPMTTKAVQSINAVKVWSGH